MSVSHSSLLRSLDMEKLEACGDQKWDLATVRSTQVQRLQPRVSLGASVIIPAS